MLRVFLGSMVLMVLSSMTGCASHLYVTYESDPPGAVLYRGTQRVDYTPYTATYKISKDDEQRGFMEVPATRVQWVSGASVQAQALTVKLAKPGDSVSQSVVFKRPDNLPGLDKDMRFSLELDRTKAAQRQAAAQEEQARALRRQADAQERQADAQEKQARAEKEKARLAAETARLPKSPGCHLIAGDPSKGIGDKVLCN